MIMQNRLGKATIKNNLLISQQYFGRMLRDSSQLTKLFLQAAVIIQQFSQQQKRGFA
jgi:hypothetical protein